MVPSLKVRSLSLLFSRLLAMQFWNGRNFIPHLILFCYTAYAFIVSCLQASLLYIH
ncbi:hypothetical protein H8958_015566, partial [Nasalis larvatus]